MKLMMKVKWIRDNRFTALLAISIKTDKILFVKHYTNFKQNGYRVSELFQPINTVPHAVDTPKNNITNTQKDLSKSSKLLVDNGLVKCAYPGNYVFLPLGMRVLEKLTKLVDDCMRHVGGQKMLLPTLTQADLWKKTGRYEKMKDELLLTKDRHNRTLVFSPTHEEAVTNIVSELSPLSYKSLPLRLYQTSSKFRDEMKPRFGLLRSREFIMNDLYTFDKDQTTATITYDTVIDAYSILFDRLRVPWRRVAGDCGDIGGQKSHEFHFPAEIGQDSLLICSKCESGQNSEIEGVNSITECQNCGGSLTLSKGIEVAHAFFLSDTYSTKLNATFIGMDKKVHHLQMGCYGIGISRLIGACVEVLSTHQELRWPETIAPFSVCVICPKAGSREAIAMNQALGLYEQLNDSHTGLFPNDVILDDRDKVTVGKKLRDAYKIGYTYIILFGKNCIDKDNPEVELHCPLHYCAAEDKKQMTTIPLANVNSILADKLLII